LTTVNNLAAALDSLGKHAEAVTVYRELLPVVRRVMGPEHPLTLAIANNLAACSRAARSTPSH
jgi:hypothetical protein